MRFFLNQPNNLIINHLGKGSWWRSSETAQKDLSYLSPLPALYFNKLFRIIFVSGIFQEYHQFFNSLFFIKNQYTFPINFNVNLIKKFYREVRLKILINRGGKKNFFARKIFQTLNISEINFFKKSNFTILSLDIHLPAPYKRNFYARILNIDRKRDYNFRYKYILNKLCYYTFVKF